MHGLRAWCRLDERDDLTTTCGQPRALRDAVIQLVRCACSGKHRRTSPADVLGRISASADDVLRISVTAVCCTVDVVSRFSKGFELYGCTGYCRSWLNQFSHWFAKIDEELRTSGRVGQCRVHYVDTKVVIRCPDDLLNLYGTGSCVFAQTIC